MIVPVLIAVLVLAFANGANDNAKGGATLVGGRTLDLKPALGFAAITTFAGSVCALLLAGGLIAKFSGKGLVDAEVLSSGAFPACVGCAAAGTVLIATRFGIPVSTTHALVGGLVGTALSAGALHGTAIVSAFLVPLLVSPLFALVLASARVTASWQPMIGCSPALAQAPANSSAPNRLPVSVIATAGIRAARLRATISGILSAPSSNE